MNVRPVSRDTMPDDGRPIVAMRCAVEDRPPCRAPVSHGHAALAFQTRGRSRMEQNGEWTLEVGDVLLVPAGQMHRGLGSQRSEYWGLSFCVPCFAADGAATFLEPFERVREGASAVVRIPAARHRFLEDLFRELEASGRTPSDGEGLDVVQRSLLALVLHEVAKATPSDASRARAGGSVVIDGLRFIERNCLRKLTLDDVASAVGRSPAYVTSALKSATGRSAGAWILSGRMAEARRLLLHSNDKVDVVAERVGYADATHFIRMFRRVHGATPAAWRQTRRHAPGSTRDPSRGPR